MWKVKTHFTLLLMYGDFPYTNLAMNMFVFCFFFSGDGGMVLTISISLHTNPTLKHLLVMWIEPKLSLFCDHYLLMPSDRASKPALKLWASVFVRVIQSQH